MAINLGTLEAVLTLRDEATPKLKAFDSALVQVDQHLHQVFGAFAQFQEHSKIVGIGIQQFGSHVARLGDRLTLLSSGIAAVGLASLKMSTTFQTNMTKIVNLTDIGAKGITDMRDAVLKMGPEVAQGPLALSDALYSIGSVGITGAAALDTLRVSAKATAVGLGETKDVARAISAAVVNFAEDGMTAAKAGDILTAAVREGGAEASEFANTLGRVIATAKTIGISFEEVTASVATFTRLGVRADEAVTALRGTMAFLMKPSEGAKNALEKVGLTIEQVREKVKKSGLAEALIDIFKATKRNEEIIGEIIPNVRALAGVLANAGSQGESYRKILDNIKNSTGTLDSAFSKVAETLGFKFQVALAKLQVLGIHLGDVLLPAAVSLLDALTPLLDVLGKMVSAFEFLPVPVKIATAAFIAFSLAIGPIASIGGRMIEALGLLTRLFTGVRNLLFGTTAATVAAGVAQAEYHKLVMSEIAEEVAARRAAAAADQAAFHARVMNEAKMAAAQQAATEAARRQAEVQAAIRREQEFQAAAAARRAAAAAAAVPPISPFGPSIPMAGFARPTVRADTGPSIPDVLFTSAGLAQFEAKVSALERANVATQGLRPQLLLTGKAFAELDQKLLSTVRIAGLLPPAAVSIRQGWTLARDSTGQFAKQLEAVNPSLLEISRTSRIFYSGMQGVSDSLTDVALATGIVVETVSNTVRKGVREITTFSNVVRDVPLIYQEIVRGAVQASDEIVAVTLALTSAQTVMTAVPAAGAASVAALAGEVAVATTAMVVYNRGLQTTVATGYTPFITATNIATASVEGLGAAFFTSSKSMKLLGPGITAGAVAVDAMGRRTIYLGESMAAAGVEADHLGRRLFHLGGGFETASKDAQLAVRGMTQLTTVTKTAAAEAAAVEAVWSRRVSPAALLLSGAVDALSKTFVFLTTTVTGLSLAIPAVFTALGAAAITITDKWGSVKRVFDLVPMALRDLLEAAQLVGTGWVRIFEMMGQVVVEFGNTIEREMPAAVTVLADIVQKHLDQALILFAIWKDNIRQFREFIRQPITTEGIEAEAASRLEELDRRARLGGTAIRTGGTKAQRDELNELLKVYDELTNRVDKLGQKIAIPPSVAQVLAEEINRVKIKLEDLPKEVQIFIKLHLQTEPTGGPALEDWETFGENFGKRLSKAAEEATKKLEADTTKITDKMRAVTDAINKLRTQKPVDFQRLVLGITQPGADIKKMAQDYASLFGGSADVAEAALLRMRDAAKETARVAKRETSWIENLNLEAKTLEAQLGEAFKSGEPFDFIMERMGSNIERTTGKLRLMGRELGPNTQLARELFEEFEAEEPFRKIQEKAYDANRIVLRMIDNGRSMQEIYEIMGDSAVDAGMKAAAIGGVAGPGLDMLRQHVENLAIDKTFSKYTEALDDFARQVSRTEIDPAAQEELIALGTRRIQIMEIERKALEAVGATKEQLARFDRNSLDQLREMERGYVANANAIKQNSRALQDMGRAFEPDTVITKIKDIRIEFQRQRDDIPILERLQVNYLARIATSLALEEQAVRNVTEAWVRSGALTRKELELVAALATERYERVRKSGLFAAEDIEKAWAEMVEANIRAQDRWIGGMMEAVASMPDVLSKAFTDMANEATTFKEFFINIWKSIQSAITNVFLDMVQSFIRNFLQRMLASILQARNPIQQAIGSLVGGQIPGMGGGGGIPGLGEIGDIIGMAGAGGAGGAGMIPGVGEAGDIIGMGGIGSMMRFGGGGLLATAGATMWKQAQDSIMQNMMGGGMTGAGIGTMIMPGIGTAIGFGVGMVIGLVSSYFRKPEYKKIMEQVGRDLGVDISEGLAKEIEGLAKTIEGGTKAQRRAMAEILSLDKIIEEGGGLTPQNVQQYQMLAYQLFKPIQEGSKQAGLATEQLNKLVGMFAQQADKTGGLWSDAFKEIIGKAKEMGLELENVTAALNAQMEKLASGLDKLTAGFEATLKKDFANLLKGTGLEDAVDALWEAFGDPEKMTEAMAGMKDKFVEEFEKKFKDIPELDDAAEAIFEALGDPSKLQAALDKLDLDKELEQKVREFAGGFDIWTILLGGPDKMGPAMEKVKAQFITAFESNFKDIPELDKVGEQIWEAIGDPEKLERVIDRLDLSKDIEKKVREFVDAFDIDKALKEVSLGEFTEKAQKQFDRLSRIAFASFNAMIKQGKSAVEAIDAIGASVDRLISIHDKLGLKGSAAYDALARFRNLVKDNRELVDSATGLNDVLVALSNIGGMTADIFADLQGEAGTIFEQLKAAGFSTNEALSIMAPSLQTLIDLAEKYGFKIDDATQAIIDQAREAGILKEKQMSTNDILMTGFTAIIEALGGELPQAFRDFAEEAKRKAKEVEEALDKATKDRTVDVDVDVHMPERGDIEIPFPEWPEGPRTPGGREVQTTAATGGLVTAQGIRPFGFNMGGMVPEYMAEGGVARPRILQFTPRGSDTVPAMLTPGEIVINAAQQENIAEDLMRQPQTAPVNINISLEGATIRNPEDAKEIGIALAKEMRRNPRVREALGGQIINVMKQNRVRVS